MKKLVLIAMAAFLSVSALAQGTVNFSLVPHTLVDGYGSPIAPGGTIVGALFYAPGTGIRDEDILVQAGATATPGPVPGWLTDGVRTLDGVAAGGMASVQVRLWDTADIHHLGFSDIVEIKTGGDGDPATLPASLPAGIAEFFMTIPEPSTFALAGLCGVGAFFFRRRK